MKIDERINQIDETILEMGYRVKGMFELSLRVLESGDKEKALYVVESDDFINNYNEEINNLCINVLSLLQPVASDLRGVISAIKIANDMERIGDYAKSIARYVIRNDRLDDDLLPVALQLGELFVDLYGKTLKALKETDIKMAYEIPVLDEKIDQTFKSMGVYVEDLIKNGNRLEHPFATISMMRNIERAGDHAKNICEHLIYRIKGQYIDFG
jgi:phosphate transport system protein